MTAKKESASKTDWLYLLFLGILPFVYVKSLVDYTLIPRQLFVAVFILLTALFTWKFLFNNNRLIWSAVSWFGFMLITTISSFWAINAVESMASLARYGITFSFLAVTANLLQQKKLTVTGLLRGVVVFAAIASVSALIKIFEAIGSGDFFENIYAVKATFSHKNILSAVLMLSLPFTIAGAILFKGLWRSVSLGISFLIVAEIFVLRTRGVWLSTFTSAAVVSVLFFLIRKRQRSGLKYPVKYIVTGVVIALVLMIGLLSVDNVGKSLLNRANLDRRLVFWQNSMEMNKDHPLLGVGAGNWKIHFPKYGLKSLDWSVRQGITHIQRPHNDYIWTWTEGGPLAMLLYLGVFVFAFIKIASNLKGERTKEERIVNWCMAFGIFAYMIFSFTDFPMERMEANVLIMSMIALVYGVGKDSGLKLSGGLMKGILLLLLGSALLICYNRWQGEKASAKILQANSQRNAPLLIRYSEEAENSFYNMDNFANPIRYYSSLGKMVQRNHPAALTDAQIAYDLHPNNIVVLNQLGNVLKHLGKEDEALDYYYKATAISDIFELSLLSIAEIQVRKGNYLDAMVALLYADPESQNGKFLKLMEITLPHIVHYPDNDPPKLQRLIEHMKAHATGNEGSYLQIYRKYRAGVKAEALRQAGLKG